MTFDEWRASYARLTDREQLDYLEDLSARYPDQARANHEQVSLFLAGRTGRVVEIGGHVGLLAQAMLARMPGLTCWLNLEASKWARTHDVCDDPRYRTVDPGGFYWWRNAPRFPGSILVASHVLEHFSAEDVGRLLYCFPQVKDAYVECPLEQEPSDWRGYEGTHILEVGWEGLEQLFASYGFTVGGMTGGVRTFVRE